MTSTTPLLHALSEVWAPFVLTGKIYGKYEGVKPIYLHKGSTIYDLKVDKLIAGAKADPRQPYAHMIPVKNLNPIAVKKTAADVVYKVEKLAPQQKVTTLGNKLLLHTVGYSQEQRPVMSSAKAVGHIGTLVVILNSEYTGGELEVTHGGRTEVVTGPYSWVAMYGDCLHKINPVTSGTRVSLVYDIYAAPRVAPLVSAAGNSDEYGSTVWTSFATDADKAHGASENTRNRIHSSIRAELQESDALYIALQQLYPELPNEQLMLQPSVLNCGDRAMYDIITQDDIYDVSYKLVTVYETSHEWVNSNYKLRYSCTAIVQLFPTNTEVPSDTSHTKGVADVIAPEVDRSPVLKRQKRQSLHPRGAKLIVATSLAQECTMYHRASAEWTGTESLPEITIYLVRALQVCKKG